MEIRVLTFGQLQSITGSPQLTFRDITDTDALHERLLQQYPGLQTAQYAVAVDQQIISENTILNDQTTVALLPPFSGG